MSRHRIGKLQKRSAKKAERHRMGRLSKKEALKEFALFIRRWRNKVSRSYVAKLAGVERHLLNHIEHNHADDVRLEDIHNIMLVLSELRPLKEEECTRVHSLLRIAAKPKFKRDNHRERYRQRQLRR